jgi:quercetin dioxygenase-like cupin family protein
MKKILTSKSVGLPFFTSALIACTLIIGTIGVSSAIAADKEAKITVVYEHALPNVPGKSIKGVLVEYGPGGKSPAHTHPKSAFIYATVLEGAIQSAVNDGPVVTYRKGENWSEMPGDRHNVSANASTTEPAKILAVFVVDTDEKELLTPYEK